ncbi:tubulin nucleotide-binding domain-like protein [Leucogyrophana mollusca]|uniref:Tubulin nucleotide-binding domain-like protein n=1 Tax=Leucogyrophana mollusca TaxID=85980 RepID=A0ACB8BND3_9AGAM|nr:tubulin nucleotide-binding domain-like protein [Leucogyrophana mollusca]
MREIIYIQAGSLANYIGTHFWNAQESYFTYGDEDESIANHDISFKEGRDNHSNPTLCPRLLAFDNKSQFGTLAKFRNAEEDQAAAATWGGEVVQHNQDPVPPSEYHIRLEEGEDEHSDDPEDTPADAKIRYWSDFSRVFFDPKTVQMVPDTQETAEGDWNIGQELYQRYNEETELMDGAFRLLVEDCNNFQGLQVVHETTNFGSFTSSLLTTFRDEYRKAPILTFDLLSNALPADLDVGQSSELKKALNDAMCLYNLNELSDMNIPLQHPSYWAKASWRGELNFDRDSMYHVSAIVSAHMETSTLPLRLKNSGDDLSSIGAQLNWRRGSRFGELSGILPASLPLPLDAFSRNLFNFSTLSSFSPAQAPFARRDVTRGFSADHLKTYSDWCELVSLREPFLARTEAPPYPLPSSFPPILSARPRSTAMFSALSTGPSTASLICSYAKFVDGCARRKNGIIMGIEDDDIKNLANELWTIYDNSGGEEEVEEIERGEDEE